MLLERLNADSLAKIGNEKLSKRDPHTCIFCQKVISNRYFLKDHFEVFHLKKTKFFCDLCPKFYYFKYAVARHMRYIHCNKRFACNVCSYRTANSTNFRKHKLTHAAKVKCPVCEKPVIFLSVHLKTHKPKESCPICNKMISKYNLKAHLNFHARDIEKYKRCTKLKALVEKGNENRSGKDPFTCSICGKVSTTRALLKVHIQTFHLKATKWLCDLCPKFFYNREDTYSHMKLKHRKPALECKVCGYKTNAQGNYQAHKLIHNEKKECPVCKKLVSSMKTHMMNHAPKKMCPICHCMFKALSLSKHIKTHKKDPKCEICNKKFTNKEDFKR